MIHYLTISFKILFQFGLFYFYITDKQKFTFLWQSSGKIHWSFLIVFLLSLSPSLDTSSNFFLWNIFIFSSVYLRFPDVLPSSGCLCSFLFKPILFQAIDLGSTQGFVLKHLLISCSTNNLGEIIHLKLEKFKVFVFELNHWHSHATLKSPNTLWTCIFLWSLKLSGN